MKTLITFVVVVISCSLAYGLTIQWEHILDEDTAPMFVSETEDGGYLIFGGWRITRLNSDLDIEWTYDMVYPGQRAYFYPRELLRNTAGNWVVVGNRRDRPDSTEVSCSDIFFYEFTDQGDSVSFTILWDDWYTFMTDVIITDDGNYLLLVGTAPERGEYEWHVNILNHDYELIEDNFIRRPGNALELTCVIELDEGGFLLAGRESPRIGDQQPDFRTMFNLDENCDIIWQRHSGQSSNCFVNGLVKTDTNQYSVWGNKHCPFIVNYDENGVENDSIFWSIECEYGQFATFGNDNFLFSFYFEGNIHDEVFPDSLAEYNVLMKFNNNCDSLDCLLFSPEYMGGHSQWFQDMIPTSDGGALILTNHVHIERRREISRDYLIKIAPEGWVNSVENESRRTGLDSHKILFAYPNPFNNSTTIRYSLNNDLKVEVAIYNACGQQVDVLHSGHQKAGNYSLNWKADNINSGFYFIRLSTPEMTVTSKTLLIR